MSVIKFNDIPVPPSVNQLYIVSGLGRTKTTKYRKWLEQVGWEYRSRLIQQSEKSVPSRISIAIDIFFRIDRKRDLDNCLKAVLDSLQKFDIIPDDRYIDIIYCKRAQFLPEQKNKNTFSIIIEW